MLKKVKTFIKEHKGAVVGTTAAVAGMIIGYSCGRNHVIAQLQGYNHITYLTQDHKWARELYNFVDGCCGKKIRIFGRRQNPVGSTCR